MDTKNALLLTARSGNRDADILHTLVFATLVADYSKFEVTSVRACVVTLRVTLCHALRVKVVWSWWWVGNSVFGGFSTR